MNLTQAQLESWYRSLAEQERQFFEFTVGLSGLFHPQWIVDELEFTLPFLQRLIKKYEILEITDTKDPYYDLSQSPYFLYVRRNISAARRRELFDRSTQLLEQVLQEHDFKQSPQLSRLEIVLLEVLGKAAIHLGNILVTLEDFPKAIFTYHHYAGRLEAFTQSPAIGVRYLALATSGHWVSFRIGKPTGTPLIFRNLWQKANQVGNPAYELCVECLEFMHLDFIKDYSAKTPAKIEHLLQKFGQLEPRSLMRQIVSVFVIPILAMNGEPHSVIDIYEKTLPPMDSIPTSLFQLLYVGIVAGSHAMNGHTRVGVGIMNAVNQEAIKQGYRGVENHCNATMAYLFYTARRYHDAEKFAKLAVQLSTATEDWVAYPLANVVLAIFALRENRPEEARKWIESLPNTSIFNAALTYTDLFFDLFLEAQARQCVLHPEWNLIRFCQTLQSRPNPVSRAYLALRKIFEQGHQEESYWPPQSELEPLLFLLKKSKLMLPMGNLAYWLAQRAEKLGRPEELRTYAQMAYVALVDINVEIFPQHWLSWVNLKDKESLIVHRFLEISRSISSFRKLDELYSGIVDLFATLTYSERRALFLADENGVLRLKATRNFTDDLSVSILRLVKQVAQQRQGKLIKGSLNEPLSQLIVPLILHERLIGVIYEENQLLPGAFNEQDLEILTTFGLQIAVTIDNVQSRAKLESFSQKLRKMNRYYLEEQQKEIQGPGIIGQSSGIQFVLEQINQVARLDTAVLVTGETGVGKELVSACIHFSSSRSTGPFVVANCAALSGSLIENELFGHEKGAFTGADSRRIGRFELADDGTLFLDEIGELPLELQVKLLRVLQNGEFQRVGGNKSIKSNFRLVAATNRNLAEEVQNGRFRRDLYYRLKVFPIEVPPLRQRREDIALLAEHFIHEFSTNLGKPIAALHQRELKHLTEYDWPGNVRELRHVIERAIILSKDGSLHFEDIGPQIKETKVLEPLALAQIPKLDETIRMAILHALEITDGQIHGKGGAAEILDLNPNTLRSKMKKLGINTKKSFFVAGE